MANTIRTDPTFCGGFTRRLSDVQNVFQASDAGAGAFHQAGKNAGDTADQTSGI